MGLFHANTWFQSKPPRLPDGSLRRQQRAELESTHERCIQPSWLEWIRSWPAHVKPTTSIFLSFQNGKCLRVSHLYFGGVLENLLHDGCYYPVLNLQVLPQWGSIFLVLSGAHGVFRARLTMRKNTCWIFPRDMEYYESVRGTRTTCMLFLFLRGSSRLPMKGSHDTGGIGNK